MGLLSKGTGMQSDEMKIEDKMYPTILCSLGTHHHHLECMPNSKDKGGGLHNSNSQDTGLPTDQPLFYVVYIYEHI